VAGVVFGERPRRRRRQVIVATFLTTSKMDPALAARIDASVRGRRGKPRLSTFGPRAVAFARLGAVATCVLFVTWVVLMRGRNRQDVEQAKSALRAAVRDKRASLTPYDRACVTRAASWLGRFSQSYAGDVIASELRSPGAFESTLARPIVYVRGPIAAFTSTAGMIDAALTSTKDPLALCLVQPPHARAEKVLTGKVRAAYAGGAVLEIATSNVRRLGDAALGLPLLAPPWSMRVEAATDLDELAKLRRELSRAPIERATQAAKAGLLLFAMDEVGEGPTELDGERAHSVRIGLVDVVSSKVLLLLRKSVDPAWISVAMRAELASGLDGCALAMDVHDAVRAASVGREPVRATD
jgi:hypothetical protein